MDLGSVLGSSVSSVRICVEMTDMENAAMKQQSRRYTVYVPCRGVVGELDTLEDVLQCVWGQPLEWQIFALDDVPMSEVQELAAEGCEMS